MQTIKKDSKTYKYFKARTEGKTKKESCILANANPNSGSQIENTKQYALLEENFKDILQKKLTKDIVAQEHVKIIQQNGELSSKLSAIKLYYEVVEPDKQQAQQQQVNIVLR
jgi:hypothetical protein